MKKFMSAALAIVAGLGAYKPRVTEFDPKVMEQMRMSGKRRTRPMIGRGGQDKVLKDYFESEVSKERRKAYDKKVRLETGAANAHKAEMKGRKKTAKKIRMAEKVLQRNGAVPLKLAA